MHKTMATILVFTITGAFVQTLGAGDALAFDTDREASQMAQRLMAVVDAVFEHHILPPTRQQLVSETVSQLYASSGRQKPLGLSRRLSKLVERDDLLKVVEDATREVLAGNARYADEKERRRLEQEVIHWLLSLTPGLNLVATEEEHVVNEQFAANRYVGTGIVLRTDDDRKRPQMTKVFPDGPAARTGAQDNDLIEEIDGVSTEGMELAEVVRRLRGPEGSPVEVVLRQPDADKSRRMTITRGVVPLTFVRHDTRRLDDGRGVVFVSFERVSASTVHELRKIDEQAGPSADAILLDLRGPTAFNLHNALLLADALLDGGVIGRVRSEEAVRQYEASRGSLFGGRSLFALVGPGTSGPMEWIAAALQDSDRATLIGWQTAGDAFISEPVEVPGTAWVLRLATGLLQRGDGRPLQRTSQTPSTAVVVLSSAARRAAALLTQRAEQQHVPHHDGGVIPDIELPATAMARRRPGAAPGDAQLEAALKAIEAQLSRSR